MTSARRPERTQAETLLIFEIGKPGRVGFQAPSALTTRVPDGLPDCHRRKQPPRLPEVTENQAVRHYTNLSVRNHHIDRDFYPLGSCTMKYNPKINDEMSALPGMAGIHPLQDPVTAQGAMQ